MGSRHERWAVGPLLVLAGACGGAETAPAGSGPARTGAVPAAIRAALAGEVVVRGAEGLADAGSLTVALVAAGEDRPALARSWELADPAWRRYGSEQRLYFTLDPRDAASGPAPEATGACELIVRWDPDGNPATDEAGVVVERLPVARDARDLRIDLTVDRALVHDLIRPAVEAAGDGG